MLSFLDLVEDLERIIADTGLQAGQDIIFGFDLDRYGIALCDRDLAG